MRLGLSLSLSLSTAAASTHLQSLCFVSDVLDFDFVPKLRHFLGEMETS